jgi:hypothetical protein
MRPVGPNELEALIGNRLRATAENSARAESPVMKKAPRDRSGSSANAMREVLIGPVDISHTAAFGGVGW